jgi:hypothetical protein
MWSELFDMVAGWGPSATNPWLKGHHDAGRAYEAAWPQRAADAGTAPLIAEMRKHNVPYVYTRPESRAELAVWFEAWSAGTPPSELRARLAARERAQRGR